MFGAGRAAAAGSRGAGRAAPPLRGHDPERARGGRRRRAAGSGGQARRASVVRRLVSAAAVGGGRGRPGREPRGPLRRRPEKRRGPACARGPRAAVCRERRPASGRGPGLRLRTPASSWGRGRSCSGVSHWAARLAGPQESSQWWRESRRAVSLVPGKPCDRPASSRRSPCLAPQPAYRKVGGILLGVGASVGAGIASVHDPQ